MRISVMVLVLVVLACSVQYGYIRGTDDVLSRAYPLCGVVVELDRDNDVVTVEDLTGNLWQFDGCEDWCIMDVVSMIMDDKGTEIIFDDSIIDIKYCGWIEQTF